MSMRACVSHPKRPITCVGTHPYLSKGNQWEDSGSEINSHTVVSRSRRWIIMEKSAQFPFRLQMFKMTMNDSQWKHQWRSTLSLFMYHIFTVIYKANLQSRLRLFSNLKFCPANYVTETDLMFIIQNGWNIYDIFGNFPTAWVRR